MSATVLLVDDDPTILTLLEYTFRRQGYEIATARDGAAAFAMLGDAKPDLIVTDVMMPVMDGYELCRKVRSDDRWRTLPFIFLSARGSTDDRIAGLDLGADDYVVKPFDRRELLAKAKTLLNRVRIYRDQIVGEAAGREISASEPEPSSTGASPAGPARILVVDDEDPMRRLVAFNLKKAGFAVSTARNGEEALEVLGGIQPDLIISDVMMPVMDGLQLRKSLVGQDRYSGIPFLFLTAKGQPEDMMAGLLLGADDYITKPVNPQVLVQKARNLIERYRAGAERSRRELQQAAARVSSQLEPDVPRLEHMTFSQRCEPLEIRGGDYYDYIALDDGSVAFVLGDVMGKKWGAWFFSVAYIAYLRSVLRATAASQASPSAIVRQANRILWEDLKISEVFTTLVFGIVDSAGRTVTFANAGHLPPIVYRAETNAASSAGQGGLILGVQPDQEYEEETFELGPGDALVFYSDGITEARNREEELFGEQRLRETVRAVGGGDGAAIIEGIFQAVAEFVSGMPYEDDRTVLVVRADGQEKPSRP